MLLAAAFFGQNSCPQECFRWIFEAQLGSIMTQFPSLKSASITSPLRRFDMHAFHAALDAARQSRGLSWAELAAETNRPFEGTISIPIHPATLRGMPTKRSVTSAVVLQALAWLGQTPESFLTGLPTFPVTPLPKSGPGRVLRFDTVALHAALNAQRQARGLSWAQAASELPGFTSSMLTNLATGPLIGFPRVMLLFQWLGQPAAHFVRVRAR